MARVDVRRLRSLFAMYALHGLNIGVPLITLPVLARVLGPDQYGRYGVMLTWASFGLILIDFGMGIGATKALTGSDPDQAALTLGRTLVYQTLNAACVLPVLALGAAKWMEPSPCLADLALVLACAWSGGVSTLWYRVARASVTALLPATIATKLLCIVLVMFVLPRHPSLTIALVAYLASVAWSLLDAWRARRAVMAAMREFTRGAWLGALRASAPVPAQRVGSALYLLLPPTLAAHFFDLKVAGWFVLTDRIVRGLVGLFQPLTATLFPLQLEVQSLPADAAPRRQLRSYLAITVAGSLAAAALTGFAAGPLVKLVGGDAFSPAAELLRWMAPVIALVPINMLLTNELYTRDREPVIARAVWGCGLLFAAAIAALGGLAPWFFAACCMLVEALVLLWLAFAVYDARRTQQPPPGGGAQSSPAG